MTLGDRTLLAFERIARPFVRLLIARGVRFSAVAAVLKRVFVNVAESDFRIDGKSPTDSRVSLLTGVHRQDVGRIRRDGRPSSVPSAMSLSATVVGRWLGDPDYVDKQGRAKTLFRSADRGSPNFEELARRCSKDVHPRTILDELINQNFVEWDDKEDVVVLTSRAYLPTDDNDEIMHFFEMNVGDHLEAAVHNIIEPRTDRRFLERAVYYNSLSPDTIERLGDFARARADKILNELNSEALRRQDTDRKASGVEFKRFRFGVFFYSEDDDTSDDDD
ncbi:MAG: DUF6502 family protein [Pseudomonadota bacterium]